MAEPTSATSDPSFTEYGPPELAVGATFRIVTVAELVSTPPSSSVTRRTTVAEVGPSRSVASKVADAPGVSNTPSLSRSHAKLRISAEAGSVAEPISVTSEPSFTLYGPPALAVGATLSIVIVAGLVSTAPSSSVTLRVTTVEVGPSRAEASKVGDAPGVSNTPSLFRSHSKVRISAAPASVAVPVRPTDEPSLTAYGPPALDTGGRLTTVTTSDPTPVSPSSSVASAETVTVAGPSGNEQITEVPAPSSNSPSPSQSQTMV